jgi:plasmid stabilization system protein ParE
MIDSATSECASAEREIRDLSDRINRIVAAIEIGTDTEAMRNRLKELECQKAEFIAGKKHGNKTSLLQAHPNLAELYRRKVHRIREELNADAETRRQTAQIFRSLIERIVIHPESGRGKVRIELYGQITGILDIPGAKNEAGTESVIMMVAAEGLEPPTKGL